MQHFFTLSLKVSQRRIDIWATNLLLLLLTTYDPQLPDSRIHHTD